MNEESCSQQELLQQLQRSQQRVAELEAAEDVRRESEQRYRIINQTISDYAFSLHRQADGTFVLDWLTESFTNLTGYPVGDLLGKPNPFHAYIHPDDLDQVIQTLATMQPDAPAAYEFQMVTKTGDIRWLHSSTRAVTDETGQIVGFYGATQDITERKQAETERQKAVATLQAAVDGTAHTGEAFFQWLVRYLSSTLDIQYTFVGELVGEAQDQIRTLAYWANGDLSDNFQYEFVGSPCETVIGQQLRHYPRAVAARFPDDEDLKTLQTECYLGTPLFSATGKSLGLIVLMGTQPEGTTPLEESALLRILASRAGAEIERQQAEAAVRTSEQQFRTLATAAPIGIFQTDETGAALYANPRMQEIAGFTLEESLGDGWSTFIAPDDRDGMIADWQACVRNEQEFLREVRFQRPTGEVRSVLSRGTALRTETGQLLGYVGSVEDLTDRIHTEVALQESEEQYRNLVESTHDLIQSVGPDGRFLFVNQAWTNTLGYTAADLEQRTLFDIIHPDSQAHCQAMFARVMAGESLANLHATFVTKDGHAIPVEGNVAGRYSGGALVATHGFFRDISERKQAEAVLQALLEHNQRILDTAGEGIYGVDVHGNATFMNPAALLLLGWQEAEVMGKNQHALLHHSHPDGTPYPREDCPIYAAFKDGAVHRVSDEVFWRKDGTHFPVEYTSTPIADDHGVLTGAVVVFRDITERKRAEATLQRNDAWKRSLLQATQDAFISINRQGCIARFNPAAERIFGYTQADVQGQKVNLLMPELYAQEHDSYIERFERTRDPHAIGQIRTVTAKRKNGAVFPIELSVTEVATDDVTEYGAFIRDISEKVQLQEQLVERERLAAIGTTAATLAHEIGNPLNGMSLNMQLMQRRLAKVGEGMDARFVGYVGSMQHEITRLTNLLHEFRSVSRRQTFTFQPLNLVTVIQELLAAEMPHYIERGVQVKQVVPDALPPVQADPDKLKQVCLNLCKNAVEAMPAGGTLTLRAHAVEEHVHLEVTDTGEGIPDEVNIFEPFATTKVEGTGLGLPIVQQIITGHGGTLRYTSTPGQGTTFTVALPLRAPGATR